MGYTKLSVTIPEEMYEEIKDLSLKRKCKISHFVSEAIAEKTKKMKAEALIQQINEVLNDPDVLNEQGVMAKMIADNTDLEELQWVIYTG
jgi:post-segregation antitoxin (ccd killing protein)